MTQRKRGDYGAPLLAEDILLELLLDRFDLVAVVDQRIHAMHMEKLMLTHIEVKESDLRTLASQRSMKVKEAILKSKQVEPERVFILEPKSLAPEKKEKVKESGVDFKLK